jgi:hypothetical protein
MYREQEIKAFIARIKNLVNRYTRKNRAKNDDRMSIASNAHESDDDYEDDDEMENRSFDGNGSIMKPKLLAKIQRLQMK